MTGAPGANFKLDVYYRMCDELVTAMKEFPVLIQTHMSRYEDAKDQLYEDSGLHVLAFDMIYSSQVYNLYDGIQYSHPKGADKKLYRERVEKALALKEAYEQARADFERLEELRVTILSHLRVGSSIIHKVYGKGKVCIFGWPVCVCTVPDAAGAEEIHAHFFAWRWIPEDRHR